MLYRTMAKNGDRLSILGFGCMRLPQKKGQPGSGKIDEERATKQVRYAIDHGVNYLDTGVIYHMGASEPFLGRALRDGYREKVRLATKLFPYWVKSREDMDKLLSSQLDALNTDRIDYYLLHGLTGPSWQKMANLGVLGFLDRAKQDGRVLYAGFSFHGSRDSFREIVDAYDWEMCQIQYNFLDEELQAGTEGLKYAASKGLGVVVMEPLRGGNLARKLPAVEAIWDEADVKRSQAEWALRWVWNHPEVTVVLSGMNDEKQIDENIRIAGEALPGSLTEKELKLVSRVEGTYRSLMKAGCTGCRYCMPCPSGVDIPFCFEVYNKLHVFGDGLMARFMYLASGAGVFPFVSPSYASLCEDCGKCAKLCPQHLPIPDLLKAVAKDLEPWWFKPATWAMKQYVAVRGGGVKRKARAIEKRKTRAA